MTREEYAERARQLCNLVNNRRVQVGKEPLSAQHIQRALRLVDSTGPAPADAEPEVQSEWPWDMVIPYRLTAKGLARCAGGVDP